MHVNHGIHEKSSEWESFVKNVCDAYGIDFLSAKVSLSGLNNNLEYAAREARYKAFCEVGCDAILLAHHANDQFENFLLRLFRGSGIKGLKSMGESTPCWYDKNIDLVRPMLSITRSIIEMYATDNNVQFITDPSNLDSSFDRNYIRNNVYPVISERFEIADVNAIKSIRHLSEAYELTIVLADLDYSKIEVSHNKIDWVQMKQLGLNRLKNVIMRILDKNHVCNFTIGHIEQFANGILNATYDSKNEMTIDKFRIFKHGKYVFVENRSAGD
jgi:tRNA(Ile)-lysidine synthase